MHPGAVGEMGGAVPSAENQDGIDMGFLPQRDDSAATGHARSDLFVCGLGTHAQVVRECVHVCVCARVLCWKDVQGNAILYAWMRTYMA